MKNIILLIFIVLVSNSKAVAQVDSNLLQELEEELFTNNKEVEFLYKKIICENNFIDSTIVVRKDQPDAEKVFSLLEKILHSRNAEYFELVQDIYNWHMENFLNEWAKVYHDNYYACDEVQAQFNILKSFETVLKSLDFARNHLSAKEIFNFYTAELKLNSELLNANENVLSGHINNKRLNVIKKYKVYSEHFRQINSLGWLGGYVPFDYLDPYQKEIEPHFIDYLGGCDWNDEDKDLQCRIVWSSSKFYLKINDDKVSEYFIKNYEMWKSNKRASYIFDYAGRVDSTSKLNTQLTTLLISDWIKNDTLQPLFKQNRIELLLQQKTNLPLVIDNLIPLAETDFEYAIVLLKYLPRDDSIQYLKSQKRIWSRRGVVKSLLKEIEKIKIY